MSQYCKSVVIQRVSDSRGSALIAAMFVVAISGIMGATILFATSTDLQISGNYRRALQTFYAAEAGIVEAKVRLSGSSTSNPQYLGDPSFVVESNWSVYLLPDAVWTPERDANYTELLTNYVPVSGNLTNASYLRNSIQTDLAYWTKIYHKTEYDAEQAGHRPLTPHYLDVDGSTKRHSKRNRGNLVIYGFPHETDLKPTQFSTIGPTVHTPIEVITSQGEVEGAVSIIQVEVAHPSGPPLLAPLNANSHILFGGGATEVQGLDVCGLFPAGRPPISLASSATLVGTASLTGSPPEPRINSASLDLDRQIKDLKKGAPLVAGDLAGVSLGTLAAPAIHYAEPLDGTLTVSQVRGYGILLVKGNVQISAPFQWEGLILATGQVTFKGGLGSSILNGALYADHIQILNNDVSITLDTCPIAATLQTLPVHVLNWRQLL